MKTVKQWLSELPEPYKTKAINNTPTKDIDRECPSLLAALNSFMWADTKEGGDYWGIVFEYHHQIAIYLPNN